MPPGQVILFIIGMIAIIFAAYYVTYYVGVKASGQSRGRTRNKNINLIDRFAISRDKSFCLVEIAGKVYVIGVTNQTMTVLDTLDAASFAENTAEAPDQPMWQNVPGGRLTNKLTRKLAAFIAKKTGRPHEHLECDGGASFAESMKAASERDQPGQPGPAQAERADSEDPEGK